MRSPANFCAFILTLWLLQPAHADVAPVPADIVSWWPGEDMSLDIAGGVNGFAAGSPRSVSDFTGGVVGRAFAFDGVNRYYIVFDDNNKHNLTGDLTIEAWIRIAGDSSGARTILQNASLDAQNVSYSLSISPGGKLTFSSTTAGSKTEVSTVAVVPLDQDVHVAITLLAGDLRMYIDGQESAHIFFGTSRPTTGNGVQIGAGATSTTAVNFFKGKIDELCLYKRALTGSEIAGIQAAGALGKQRYDAARNFDSWQANDPTQSGIWRYGHVGRDASPSDPPLVAGFQEFTTGSVIDASLNRWFDGGEVIGNISGDFQTRQGAGGTNIYYPPGALILHPPGSIELTTLKWTAPAEGNYAISALFAGADGKPTTSEVVVVAKTAFGDSRILPYTQISSCLYEGGGSTVPLFKVLALAAGETVYFMVGRGSNNDASFDSTALFANIVPLSTVTPAARPTAVTGTASPIANTAATLNGTVNPKGAQTAYHFEYRTNPGALISTPSITLSSGNTAIPVSANLTDLAPNKEFFFFLVASNNLGSHTGAVQSFTTTAGGGEAGDFTLNITGLTPGATVSPAEAFRVTATPRLPRGSKTKVASVQFYIDDVAEGALDTKAKFTVDASISDAGTHLLTAVATDTNGKTVQSTAIPFMVAPAGAGPIALTASIFPNDGIALPGELITYTLKATNASNTGVKNVELTLPVPVGAGYVETRFVDFQNQPIAAPKGSEIAFNGANGTVTVTLNEVKAYADFRVQLLARVPYDQTTPGNVITSAGFSLKATQVKRVFAGTFTPFSFTVTGSLPTGAARPRLGLFVKQLGAGELPQNKNVVTVTSDVRLGVPDVKPKRLSNEITYQVTVVNYGNAAANSVRVVVPVPPDTTYKKKSAGILIAAGDSIPVLEPAEAFGLLFFDVPRLEANFPSVAGSAKTLEYTVIADKGLERGKQIKHLGAAVTSGELLTPVNTLTEKIAQVVAPAQMTYEFTPDSFSPASEPVDSASATVIHKIFFHNQGGVAAKDVGIRYTVPPGLAFQDARFANHLGAPLLLKRGQTLSKPALNATFGNVVFAIGTVKPGDFGFVQVRLKFDEATRPGGANPPQSENGDYRSDATFSGYDSSTTDPQAARAIGSIMRGFQSPQTRVLEPIQTLFSGRIPQPHRAPTIPRTFVLQAGPASIEADGEISYQIVWGNLSDVGTVGDFLFFKIPDGTEYVDATVTSGLENILTAFPTFFPAEPGAPKFPQGVVQWGSTGLNPHSMRTATVRVKVKPGYAQPAQADLTFLVCGGTAVRYCPNVSTHVRPVGTATEDQQGTIYSSAMGAGDAAAIGTARVPSVKFDDVIKRITDGSRTIGIAGADYVHIAGNDGIAIPLGGGKLVAAGGLNLVQQSSAGLVAAGGLNLVAAGGGNMQIEVPGSGLITSTQLISNAPSLVAAGGMNLVAAGGLNLVRKSSSLISNDGSTPIGMDGSTLIGLDGATLGTFSQRVGFAASFAPSAGASLNLSANAASLVAAGGGNVRIAGGGHLVAAGGGNVIPPAALVANDGASVIARDGAGLVGNDGGTLISNDGSTLIGNDGGTLVAAGGGNFVKGGTGVVPTNAGN